MEETFAAEIARRLWNAEYPEGTVQLDRDGGERMVAEAGVILAEIGLFLDATKAGAKEVVNAGAIYLATHCPTPDTTGLRGASPVAP